MNVRKKNDKEILLTSSGTECVISYQIDFIMA